MHALVLALLAAEPLPTGVVWLRVTGELGGTTLSHEGNESLEQSASTCMRATSSTNGSQQFVALEDMSRRTTFFVSKGRIIEATLSSFLRKVEFKASCDQPLEAGAVFTDPGECSKTTGRITRRCRGGACSYDDDRAPFIHSDCEKALAPARAKLFRALNATHAQALETFTAFQRLVTRGGTLWAHDTDEDGCHRVSMTPSKEDTVTLRSTVGARTTTSHVRIESLFHTMQVLDETVTDEGGFGSARSQGAIEAVSFGAGEVWLGASTLFLDAKSCARLTTR